jgi:hypothetical protein
MTIDPEDPNVKTARGFAQAGDMERLRSYRERGRRFQDVAEAELKAEYARSGNALFGDALLSEEINFSDAGAEYRLRGLQSPDHLLIDAPHNFTSRLRAAKLSDDDLEPLDDAIAEFVRDRDKPKN